MSTLHDQLKIELLQAIKHNEFILYYQPQFNLNTSRFEGIEALIRWQHPHKGLLLPVDFIFIAEESDIIVDIGEWVLRSACLQMKHWQDKFLSPVRMAVNISNRQLKQHNFYESVINILHEVKLDPTYLELELSENVIIDKNDAHIIQAIRRLKAAGILITLDDFGTGNSNMTHLAKIPVDKIKIDKTYIDNIHKNNVDAALVKSLIRFAEKMNLQIVAEGVETLMQLQMLLKQECEEIQGYYFSEPLPAEEMEKFLMANQEKK